VKPFKLSFERQALIEDLRPCIQRGERARGSRVATSKSEVKPRDVPMSDEAYEAIQAGALPVHLHALRGGNAESERARLSDQPLSAKSIWQIVKRYRAEVGLIDPETLRRTIKPHDFRRFVGKRVIKTRGVKQAQVILGHKHPSTTLHSYDIEEPEDGATNDLF
jgi:integrase